MPKPICPLLARFFRLAEHSPHAPALFGPDGEILSTRQELAANILTQAEQLSSHLGACETVVLSLPNGNEFLIAFGALRFLGVRVALVDATAPSNELEASVTAVGASAVLASSERISGELAWISGPAALGRRDSAPVALPSGAALLKMTSGSMGTPRAIVVGIRQLAADTSHILRTMGLRSDDITLAAIPLTHSYGIGSCLIPLFMVGMPQAFPTCALPAALAHTLSTAKVAHFPAVPAMIRALATLGDLPKLTHLRVCLAAGAPLKPTDARTFFTVTGCKVHNFYGSSECGGIAYDQSDDPETATGTVGTTMQGVRIELVDETGASVPTGKEGRVAVYSRAVAQSAVPAQEDEQVLTPGRFLAGDMGVFDTHSRLTLTGRVGDSLNVAGKKVHPEEVRRVIEAIPGVRSAIVTGLPDHHRGQLIAAVIAVEPGSGLTVHSVLAGCRAHLAPHKLPRRIALVDELPLSARGKVRQDAVIELLTQTSSRHAAR